MSKPVLLLDIDGVLNACSKSLPTHAWPKGDWGVGGLYGFHLKWAKPVISWIKKIHTEDRAEIRWHTTWQENAHTFACLVGLPAFKVQPCPEWPKFQDNGAMLAAELIMAGQIPWWKYPAAERIILEDKRPVVWIDDDIVSEVPRRARSALRKAGPVLFVNPSTQTGVCPNHMRQVDTFLDEFDSPRGALSAS